VEEESRLEQFQKAVEMYPDDELAHFGLGRCYYDAEDFENAVRSFRRVIALKPDYSAAYRHLGQALEKAGLVAEAQEVYESGIEIAREKGDLQTGKEMAVFLKRLRKRGQGG